MSSPFFSMTHRTPASNTSPGGPPPLLNLSSDLSHRSVTTAEAFNCPLFIQPTAGPISRPPASGPINASAMPRKMVDFPELFPPTNTVHPAKPPSSGRSKSNFRCGNPLTFSKCRLLIYMAVVRSGRRASGLVAVSAVSLRCFLFRELCKPTRSYSASQRSAPLSPDSFDIISMVWSNPASLGMVSPTWHLRNALLMFMKRECPLFAPLTITIPAPPFAFISEWQSLIQKPLRDDECCSPVDEPGWFSCFGYRATHRRSA